MATSARHGLTAAAYTPLACRPKSRRITEWSWELMAGGIRHRLLLTIGSVAVGTR